jgi:hypothetical protein
VVIHPLFSRIRRSREQLEGHSWRGTLPRFCVATQHRHGRFFQNETFRFTWQALRPESIVESPECLDSCASVNGVILAIVRGMDNRTGTARNSALTSLVRVIRGFAEGSLVALGFAVAILLIGTPLALFVRGLHEGLSWLVRLSGDTSALMEGLVSISSVAGALFWSPCSLDCSSDSSTGGAGFVLARAIETLQTGH